MIPPECKRLAEVDFPLAAVSKHAAREKSHLVRAAHGEESPLVVDPFAGGGSIPLETRRLALAQAEQERGPDFLRLANALSALYPRGSEDKRLLDAMLLGIRK